ncbi:ATP-binding protein [Blastococcus sp. SYSU DS0552]
MTTAGLVGRDVEIEALDRLLRDVRHRGAAVLVRGAPGIGKSALLHHVCEAAAQRRPGAAGRDRSGPPSVRRSSDVRDEGAPLPTVDASALRRPPRAVPVAADREERR